MKKILTTVVALVTLSISVNADSFLNTGGGVGSKNGNGYHFLEVGSTKGMNIDLGVINQYYSLNYSSIFKFYDKNQIDSEIKVGVGTLLSKNIYVENGVGYSIFNRFENTKTVNIFTHDYNELIDSSGVSGVQSESFLYTKIMGEINQDFFVEYGLRVGEKRVGVNVKTIYSIDNKLSTFINYEHSSIHNSNPDKFVDEQVISYKRNNNDFTIGINYMF